MSMPPDQQPAPEAPVTEQIPIQPPTSHWVPPTPTPPAPLPEPKRRRWVVPAALGVVVVAIIAAIAVATSSNGAQPSGSVASSAPASAASGAIPMPNVIGLTSAAAGTALRDKGLRNVALVPSTAAEANRRISSQSPMPGASVLPAQQIVLVLEAATTTVAPPPPAPPRAITAREWALIARSPDAHAGEAIIVYGQVTQFDAATGTTAFRANVDGVKHAASYGYVDYETNTFLSAPSSSMLGDLVNKDLFRAEVIVAGSYTYETTMGGQLTAPKLMVTKIQVTGQAK